MVEARRESLPVRLLKWLKLDPLLLLLLGLLMTLSCLVLFSAGGGNIDLVLRQLVRFGVAIGVMLFVAQITPHALKLWSPWIYAVGVSMLIAVAVIGVTGKGAQRWLDLGFMRFQPSEVLKLAAPMMVAWYLGDRALPPTVRQVLVSLVIITVPMLLIMDQPDLGTALLVGSAAFFALFLAGLSVRLLLAGGGLALIAAPIMWFFVMHDYQKQRVLTFLNPESDPLGSGYHIIQSKIAIGSGGVMGKGWMNGSQSQLDFLPEQSTDFIFSVFGEEFGLVGSLLLLLLYVLVLARCLRIASRAQDSYARLLAGSISLTFFVYLFVNIGMVSGLLPVVGVPLPMVSYGGTSVVTLAAGFGMLMSVNANKRLMNR
ncbi:rod shape-determining protein RodA [gamma proteobacterium HTCC5015]|nr:rod shape-determining protein RodA [gamma proteobacterium HTCC5015]